MHLRHLLLLIICFYGSTNGDAQVDSLSTNNNRKLIFSISVGATIPLGKFATFELNPETRTENISGIAGLGYNGKLQVMYLFSKRFGLSFMINLSCNKAKEVEAADLFYDPYWSRHGQGYPYRMESYQYKTKIWYTNSILSGIVFVARKDNPTINFRINGGVQKTKTPESELSISGTKWLVNQQALYPYSRNTIQPAMTSTDFVFNIGIDSRIRLVEKLGVLISADYFTARSSFNGQSIYSGNEFNQLAQPVSFEENRSVIFSKTISTLNFNVGLSYSLE